MTILRGLMTPSLGGFSTIRGYAPLSVLAKVSKADKSFQRDLLKSHQNEIKTFLKNEKDLFFPEIVLSCLLEYDFNKPKAKSGVSPLKDIRSGKAFESNVNLIKAKSIKAGTFSPEAGPEIQMVELNIPDGLETPMLRIDGNHRLSAISLDVHFGEYITPFCILLFEPRVDDGHKRHERIIFHNINYKSIPLSMEQNLKLILDEKKLFPDEELKKNSSFGWHYYFARKIEQTVIHEHFHNINFVLDGQFRTVFTNLFDLLLEDKVLSRREFEIAKAKTALSKVNEIFADKMLKESKNQTIFLVVMYYILKGEDKTVEQLKAWVSKNHLYDAKELEPRTVINIFDKIISNKPKRVFVAMPYWDHSVVTEYNKLFKEALKEIEKTSLLQLKYELIPIMRENGKSERIDQRLLSYIKGCDLFIADVTECNENVT